MLISNKYGFLFVHIAKTGGTSIRTALTPLMRRDPSRWLQSVCSRISGLTGHRLGIKFPRHAKVIAAREMLPGDYFRSLFKFAFVRNPWDLQVSSYHHIQRERPHLVRHLSGFEDFVRWKLEGDRPYHYILDASTEPQVYSLIDLEGDFLVDYIGYYERLSENFREACDRIGLPGNIRLPHRRRAAKRTEYRSYYSDAVAEFVARHYAPDIEAFGYTFD